MRNSIEAAGVHLADCTLLWCRHETEFQEARLAEDVQRRICNLAERYPSTERDVAKRQASAYVRVDGEMVSVDLALRHLALAEEERRARVAEQKRQQEEREALEQRQDQLRHNIIDSWSRGVEELEKLMWVEHGVVAGKERRLMYFAWLDSGVQQHLMDEMRLWSDEEQVMRREREAGRVAYQASKSEKASEVALKQPVEALTKFASCARGGSMKCLFSSAPLRCSERALEKFLAVPLQPVDLRTMTGNDRRHVRAAVEQLTARTARSYRAFSSKILRRSLDCETAAQLVPLTSICGGEFERCVALTEMVDRYLKHPDREEASYVGAASSNDISDVVNVESILKVPKDAGRCEQARFIDLLEDLRPRENLLDVAVNEKCINSSDLNYWIYCFCRRRVSWRVIHEHLLHLVGPGRYGPIIRADPCVGPLLQHAGTVVIDLYARMVQAVHGGSLAITVEEQPNLFTTLPAGHLVTSSITVSPTTLPGYTSEAKPSDVVFSVEGHLAYVFREIIKNACVALVSKATDMELKVYFATNDTHVIVDVVDTADGINIKTAEKFWQFGWSTNTFLCQLISGFGLGLPVSKVYMDLWNGRIDIYTTPGSGTTVRVTFPKAPVEVLLPEVDTPR